MMELEEKLGLELSPDDFYDYPTVDDLSRYLAQRRRRARRLELPPASRFSELDRMETFSSLVALLARRAEAQPDDRAYIFLR